jgi:hypothetical protein
VAVLADIETLESPDEVGPLALGDGDFTPEPGPDAPVTDTPQAGVETASLALPLSGGGWSGGGGSGGGGGPVAAAPTGGGSKGGEPTGGGTPGSGDPGGSPQGGSPPGGGGLPGGGATSAPEPATWTMMLVGLGVVGALARARRSRTILTA